MAMLHPAARTTAVRKRRVVVPRPERVRRIERWGFAWLDARLHRHRWLQVLGPEEIAVYTFLCLVADKQGVSWYRHDSISRALGLSDVELGRALRRLRELELLAYQPFHANAADGFHQVLALPAEPPVVLC